MSNEKKYLVVNAVLDVVLIVLLVGDIYLRLSNGA